MKTFTSGFDAHLASGATTLAWCWRIVRSDGMVLGFTDHDVAITFDGQQYEPGHGLDGGETVQRLGAQTQTAEVLGILSSEAISADDITLGRCSIPAASMSGAGTRGPMAGANRLAVQSETGQWEIIRFERAELVAPTTYRLSGLLRGQAGTTAGAAVDGAAVFLLDGACVEIGVEPGDLGTTLRISVHAGPRDLEGTSLSVEIIPDPSLPLGPAHLRAQRQRGSDDVNLSWIRRTRINGTAWTYADVPLDAAPERYRVTIIGEGGPVRVFDTATPGWTYAAAEQIADFGALPRHFTFTVAQISAVLGPGLAEYGDFQ